MNSFTRADRTRHRIDLNRARAAPEDASPQIFQEIVFGPRQPANGGVGDHQAPVEFPRHLLEAGCRVHDVAMEHDVAFPPSDLADDHGPDMKRPAHARRDPEVSNEFGRTGLERRLNGRKARDRAAPGPSGRFRPRDHHLVADVLIDLAPVVVHRV